MRPILVLYCSLLFFNAQAQFVVEESLDLLISGYGRNHGVVQAGEYGVVVFNELRNLDSYSTRKWELVRFDTDLKAQWRSYFESALNFRISEVKLMGEHLYLLFQDTNIPAKSVSFARVNMAKDKFEFFEVKDFIPREVLGFEVLGESMFLIGVDNNQPAILRYRFGDPRPRVLQGLFSEYNELLKTEVLPSGDQIQIISRMKRHRGSQGMILVKQFDENGMTSRELVIESSKGYNLLDAITSTDSLGNTCVVGTYSYGKSKMSNGIFSTVFDNDGEHTVYYYDYTNLHNFFQYLPVAEQAEMRKKNPQNSDKKNHRINLDLREVSASADGWQTCGEVVKLAQKNSRVYGFMWPIEYREYSHALLLGIGKDGRLRWDNSFGMNELEKMLDIQQVHFYEMDEANVLYYYDGEGIVYKLIDRGNNMSENKRFHYETTGVEFTDSEMRKNGNILPWFDNNFLIFGSYSITPKFGESRNYFFLDKVSIDINSTINTP